MLKQESINSRYIDINGGNSDRNFSKKESIHSYYTLGSASKFRWPRKRESYFKIFKKRRKSK